MTKQIYLLILVTGLLNLAAAVSSMADEVKFEGARKCITTRTLKSTAVVDDLNILFIKAGKTIYHNILPRQCQGLSRTRSFSYSTLSGSLCNFDTIQILDRHGRQGRSCRLGYFYAITIEDVPAIIEMSRRPLETEPQPPGKEEVIIKPEEIITESDEPRDSTPN